MDKFDKVTKRLDRLEAEIKVKKDELKELERECLRTDAELHDLIMSS